MSSGLSQAEIAVHRLREEIQSRRLVAGQLLTQGQLADQFGMSRTPVREALQRLEHEGLLKALPQRGWIIRTLDINEVEEVYSVRKQLEILAARLAAQRRTSDDLEEMASALQRQRDAMEGSATADTLHLLDREFHDSMWRMARSPRLRRYLIAVADSAILDPAMSVMQTKRERIPLALGEHETIYQAIADASADDAEKALIEHSEAHWSYFGELLFGSQVEKEGL